MRIKGFLLIMAAMPAMCGFAAGCNGSDNGADDSDTDTADLIDTADTDVPDTADVPEDTDVRDDAVDGDGPSICISDLDCTNGIFCDGREKCYDGTCHPAEEPECVDEFDCTNETCNEETKACDYELNHDLCDDGEVCTGQERCSEYHSCVSGTVPDCSDDDICTIDICDEDRGGCVHDPRDLDEDGHEDDNCDGDDCNDRDPEIYPGRDEICDDGKDNNCNMMVDMTDPECRPENDTCDAPIELEEDEEILGSTWGTSHNYSSNFCYIYSERDVTFVLTLEEERDLIVNVSTVTAGALDVAIQSTCGSTVSELACQSGNSFTMRRNRVPAGTYHVIVWTTIEGDFNISYSTAEPTARPANDQCGGADDVSDGGIFSDTTFDCLNDYLPTCRTGADPDTFYTFTLEEAKKITIGGAAVGAYPYVTVALMTTCGDNTSQLECATGYTSATIRRNFLEAGTYWISVDTSVESNYNLTVTFEDPIFPPPNDRCDGAIDISDGGYFIGDLMESYRDYTTSCSLATYLDVTYMFELTEPQDVTLELWPLGAAAEMALAVVGDCGDMETEFRCRRGNPAGYTLRSVPEGTYYVIVSGTLHGTDTIKGRYLLTAEYGPPTPVPANDSCFGAEDISEGGTVIGSTIATFDDYNTICGPSNYFDVVYTFTLTEDHDVIIDVDPDTTMGVALEIQRTCGSSASMLDCASSESGEMHSHSVPAGTYFLIVDTQRETDFNMEVTFEDPTTICDGAEVIEVDLSGGSFSWSDSDTTVGESNDFQATCGSSAMSPDIPYKLVVDERALVTIEDTAASFDTVLHVRSLCDNPSSQLYCDDDGGFCSLCSRISAVFAPGTYFIIQDGYSSGGSGTYTLSVTATPSS
ncbi:MAG: putative metal-binding motif-containing protein [Pseudomonadota bacterium]